MKMTWEWVGGFFEGEGCIGWYESKNGKKQGLAGRTALMNYFKAEGIDLRYGKRDMSISWKEWRKNQGLCISCGNPRDNDNNKNYCVACADRVRKRAKEWRQSRRKS